MDEKSCSGGIDFLGMFDDPVGEMIKVVAKTVMVGAFGIFEAVGDINSSNEAASNVLNRQTQWIVVYLSFGSILFAAIKMALDRRAEAGQTAMKGILRVVVVSAAASAVLNVFITLMDNYSDHLFRGSLNNILVGVDCNDNIPDMLLLVLGCLLLISAIIQALLMWIRLGVMIMLMGTLPMAAAASMTDWGGTWWRKHIGWMIAWLLYKPAVSLVLYSGAVMINTQASGLENASTNNAVNTQIAGMGTLLLSAIALPALLRLVVPATAALGGDASGNATMAVAGGLASGAKSLADSAGRNGSSGAAGSQGPSGSSGSQDSSGSSGRGTDGANGPGHLGGSSAGAASAGRSRAAAANPATAAAAVAAEVAKGVANVAKSGVEGANREGGH
jgi:hypothetical protein